MFRQNGVWDRGLKKTIGGLGRKGFRLPVELLGPQSQKEIENELKARRP